MKRLLYFFILIIFFTGCKKENFTGPPREGDWYIIEIRSMSNLDCRVPEITFLTGADEIKQLTGSNINIYVATGIPKVNYPAGTQLSVKIRKPGSNDFLVCTAMGPAYAQIVITEVK